MNAVYLNRNFYILNEMNKLQMITMGTIFVNLSPALGQHKSTEF